MSEKLLLRILGELTKLNENVEKLLDIIAYDYEPDIEDGMDYMEETEEDEVAYEGLLCHCSDIGSCPDCPHVKQTVSEEEKYKSAFMEILLHLLGGI